MQTRAPVRLRSTLLPTEKASTDILNFSVSPGGATFAVANHNGRGVNLYDVQSSQRLSSLPDDPASIWWLAWHPDGRHLALSRADGDISVWNLSEIERALASAGLAPENHGASAKRSVSVR